MPLDAHLELRPHIAQFLFERGPVASERQPVQLAAHVALVRNERDALLVAERTDLSLDPPYLLAVVAGDDDRGARALLGEALQPALPTRDADLEHAGSK